MDHYMESLPTDIAKAFLGGDYVDNCNYQIVHERQGSYIVAYDAETGERVDLCENDDYSLDVEDFEFLQDEADSYKEYMSTDYTRNGFGMAAIAAIAASICFLVTTIYIFYILVIK